MSEQVIEWNDTNVAMLKTMWAAGFPHSQIAAKIPYATRSAIAGKIMRLKLPTPERKNSQLARSHSTLPRRPQSIAARPEPRATPAKRPEPPPRRNQTNSLAEKIAIAETEPGLPERLKGEKPDGTGIKFAELNSSNCHWPKGDPTEPDFEFCGGRAIPGMPYCSHHCRISYTPAANRVRVHPRV